MKKLLLFALAAVTFTGCQQAGQLQGEATKMVDDASKQIETATTSVLDARNKVEEKVTQAQEAADAIKRLTE